MSEHLLLHLSESQVLLLPDLGRRVVRIPLLRVVGEDDQVLALLVIQDLPVNHEEVADELQEGVKKVELEQLVFYVLRAVLEDVQAGE